MENLYITSAAAFLASLANIASVHVTWFEGGYKGMDFDADEILDAANLFDHAMTIDSGAEIAIRFSLGKTIDIRNAVTDNGLYARRRD
jgi:hypothetical protein